MSTVSYMDLVNAVGQYYGTGSDQWLEIARYGQTSEQFLDIVDQLPGYRAVVSQNGKILGFEQISDTIVNNASSAINSNVPSNVVQNNYPATVNVVDGEIVAEKGISSVGASQFIFKEVVPAIAAAGVGIKLGKLIDKAAYDAGFNWLEWAGVDMESLNPDTWNSITTNDSVLGAAFNILYGFNPNDNSATSYIDEQSLAYLALYMQKSGILTNQGNETWDGEQPPSFNLEEPINTYNGKYIGKGSGNTYYIFGHSLWGGYFQYCTFTTSELHGDYKCTSYIDNNGSLHGLICSKTPFNAVGYGIDPVTDSTTYLASVFYGSYTFNNQTVYYAFCEVPEGSASAMSNPANWEYVDQLAWVLQYGTLIDNGIPGIGNQNGAVIPSLNNDMSVQDVLNALKQQYPEWWTNPITYPVMQPDGTVTNTTYVPISFPSAESNQDTKPTADGQTQSQTKSKYDPSTDPKSDGDNIVRTTQPPGSVTPPNDGGSGDTPVVIVPTGSANALYSIYNPTQGELNSFGAWLWSSDFVDQLLKLFNDPMQAIIGLHKVFATPSTSGTGPIKVGYLSSGVSAKLVNSQYVTIDCGTVSLKEKFGNVFDYSPFTQVYIYLPFIGIHQLDTGEVMRGNIKVVYHVDVLTGACLAEVNVNRDMAGGILYTFSGNCAVQYPVSSGSYMGIVTSIASIAGNIAGTVLTGGTIAPLSIGASMGALTSAKTRVSHSGSFSGAPGAMGVKKPYLIITRPQTHLAPTFPNFDGYPANHSVLLSQCSGFIKCEGVHIENVPALDSELDEIDSLLRTGVII